MRKIIEDIMYDRRKDFLTLPLRFFLRILSILYGIGVTIRNIGYNRRLLEVRDVPCKAVSIGNFLVGGTGTTPVTILTARMLRDNNVHVAVVSRGYGRKDSDPLVVSDGSAVCASPLEAGDEPHIIASLLPGVPVVVGGDRFRAAELAWNRFKPKVIVLDDALQHRRIYREVDIVTVDADDPMKSDFYLPRGLLRESPFALKRAKAVVVTRFREDHNRERIERMIHYYNRNIPVFWCRYGVKALRLPGRTETIDLRFLAGVKSAVFSNVADPDSFYRLVKSLGSTIVYIYKAADHHRYTAAELETIGNKAIEAGAGILVMTAKDERNLPEEYEMKKLKMLVLDLEAELVDKAEDYLAIIGIKKMG